MSEQLSPAPIGNIDPTTLPPEGYTLGMQEQLYAEIPSESDKQVQEYKVGGTIVDGSSVATVRLGSTTEYVDAQVVDVSHHPIESYAPDGQPVRTIGVRPGEPIKMVGDFVLLMPSASSDDMELRALVPGKMWNIGREKGMGSGNDDFLPMSVSRDHCAIGISDQGELVIENHSPTNFTTLLKTEAGIEQENIPNKLSHQEAALLLSYNDVLSGEAAAQSLAYIENNESAQKYTNQLVKLSEQHGEQAILSLAGKLREASEQDLAKLSVPISEYGKSISWAVWDIAKQSYLSEHPDESTAEYKLADPLGQNSSTESVLNDIVDRHIGWEYDSAVSRGELSTTSLNPYHRAEVEAVVTKGARNGTGQLRSNELARLGRRLRRPYNPHEKNFS